MSAVGAYRGAGIGAIADVYRPDQRGLAIGILMVSTLVGPVLGPLLGGFLAEGMLAVLFCCILLLLLALTCCQKKLVGDGILWMYRT